MSVERTVAERQTVRATIDLVREVFSQHGMCIALDAIEVHLDPAWLAERGLTVEALNQRYHTIHWYESPRGEVPE